MLITKLEVQKNHQDRANLYLDDQFYCGISIELVMKENLKKGMEIDKTRIDELVLEDEKSSALSKAVKYISSNLKTTRQIKDYLKKKLYSHQTIDYVIEKLDEYKYLDDENYAKSFVLTYSNKYGKLKLISALKSKGILDEIIDKIFSEKIESNIKSVAEKYLRNKEKNAQTYLKLSRFLYSRGYEFEEINRIINEYKEEN